MVVAELLQWRAPVPFILLSVLLGFYESALQTQDRRLHHNKGNTRIRLQQLQNYGQGLIGCRILLVSQGP